ncbi:1-acyl-sn-glycerol-3-phosphate acyltransferase [Phocaeicola sp.]
MNIPAEFNEIRPYAPEELPQICEELIADPAFRAVVESVIPDVPFEALAMKMRQCKTNLEYQKTFFYGLLWDLVKKTANGLTFDCSALTEQKTKNYTFISNHRDIILDSAFLSILLIDKDMNTVEIAIGDNLLIYPWIQKLVRVNKSFIVKRGLSMRQKLEASALMSRYMHFAITQKHENLWIAQRQGRAKDSNDRTQDSVLKMMAIGGEGDVIDSLKELNIVPLAISYEYDPCDYLKASELQQKRDDANFQKSPKDDLISMQTGLYGYKGRIHFQTAACLNHELDALRARNLPKCELFTAISETIDRHIHSNYRLYACNYVACDLLMNDNRFTAEYNEEEKEHFEKYLDQQIAKIEIPNKDVAFLRHALLTMYANPLINYLKAAKG